VSALAGRSSATAFPGSQTESAAKLRAAAAAGRIEDIGTLLAQGVPVDAADAKGDTALMESIQADQPAVAALLYQRGANLDQRNLAGLSARDMAKAKDDRVLDQALGLGP
jgi:ankyrin repeat protein